MRSFKEKEMKENGVTLIALVVIIIILLILAGITIATITSDNGIIKNANNAKEQTEIANEKEIVDRATIQAMGNNSRGNIIESELQDELDKITKAGDTDVEDTGEEFSVVFTNSNRYYTIDKQGDIIEEGKIVIDKSPGDITKDENGDDIEEGKPYEIWCIEDLVEWSNNYSNYLNSNIILGRTLNFESNYSYSNGKMLGCNSIEDLKNLLTNTSGNGFTPIQNFSSVFDGQENEIQKIYINKTGNSGFFESLSNATIENFGISGTIIGTKYVGGIISQAYGEIYIKNCYNKANISNEINNNYISSGGICGMLTGTITIINSYNAEGVEIIGSMAGGILGATGTAAASPYIYNSYNLGNINGSIVGGIIGYVYDHAECINVYSTGEITGNRVGGIVGGALWNNTSQNKFENCYFLKSDTVQQSAGHNIAVNAIILDKLTNTAINELNNYISNNNTLTIEWKKWKLEKNKYPIFE